MLEYDFMQRAFIAGILIAVLASLSGVFMVLKRYSLIGETLSHASLVGVAVGLVSSFYPLYTAVVFSLLFAWIIEYIQFRFKIYSDSVLSIVLSGSLALAVIIVSVGNGFNNSLYNYLFGSILSVSYEDLILMVGIGSIAFLLLLFNANKLYFISYDEEVAKVSGINVKFLNFLLVSIVAVIISLSISIVGSLLIGALMVIPVNTALLFKKGFTKTIILSVVFSVFSVITGIVISYYFSLPSGASIVMVVILLFLFSLVINRK